MMGSGTMSRVWVGYQKSLVLDSRLHHYWWVRVAKVGFRSGTKKVGVLLWISDFRVPKPITIQRAQYLLQYPKREGDEETIHLEIPCRMVGAIMGVDGSRIQQMEFESKASIMITHPLQGTKKQFLTISGTREQVKKAQSLLPPCAAVSNLQDSRPTEEGNCHPHKKKSLAVLKWH